jgi:hypothetical protein
VNTGTALLIMLSLCACTTLGAGRLEGWPMLRIVEHRVSEFELRERCTPYMGFGFAPQACAEIYLSDLTCHVWLSASFPPPRFIVEHERRHCEGYDHVRGKAVQRIWERYRRSEEAKGR